MNNSAEQPAIVVLDKVRRDILKAKMADIRQRYDGKTDDDNAFVSVKHLLKEFGEKPATSTNDDGGGGDDDDDAFRSVKARLRIFDARQDNNDYHSDNNVSAARTRESIGSITTHVSSVANLATPRNRFSHLRSPNSKSTLLDASATTTLDPKAYPPAAVSFLSEAENRSAAEVFKYGNVSLKKVEKPVEDRWKRNVANESPTTADDKQRKGDERISKVFLFTTPSSDNCKKPQSLSNRSKSAPTPTFAGKKQEMIVSTSVREEKYQNDLAAALKKVGLPVKDRWKSMKKSEEDVSDFSKPVFATMKLRSVGTPTNNASAVSLAYELDDKKSTLAKRRRLPTTVDIAQASALFHGERDSKNVVNNGVVEGIRVSDLAKTFSSQIKLASKGERAEEERVIGRATPQANTITYIRSTLKSSATELEEMRKSLNSCTPVSKLIAERNKAARANRSETRNIFGLTEDRRKSYCRSRSKSAGGTASSHRRTKSMLSTQTKNSTAAGYPSARALSSPKYRGNRDSDHVRRESVNTLEGFWWEDFKANSPTGTNTVWDMNLDDSSPFVGRSNSRSCTALNALSGSNNEKLLPSNSMVSGCTTDSDYDNYGHSSYIQITLSSGGIVEKCEPVVCMSETDDSSGEYQSKYGINASIDPAYDSRHSTRKALKGAKKFFFGKNKRKNGPVEV